MLSYEVSTIGLYTIWLNLKDNNFERVLQLSDVMMDTCGLQQKMARLNLHSTAGSEHLTDSTCDKQTLNLHAIKPQTTN